MENILKSEEKAGNIYKPKKLLGNRKKLLALTSTPSSLQSLCRPPLPPTSVLLSFVPLAVNIISPSPIVSLLKKEPAVPPPPTCPGPRQGSEVTCEGGKGQGPVKCFEVFLGWGLSKAHS